MPDKKPNVVLVITDDQGYGDLGCTGHPWLQTPDIDAFHDDAVRLVDFHVSPLCTPTRGALMTGRQPVRNGAWATCWGRSILRKSETTMADVFAASGYRTAMFGKWHLGDNYPYRPQDRGFQHVVAHKGGGVGQTPDSWGNNYFDDTYFHNGEPVEHAGYCTDVWFDEAIRFIEGCAAGQSAGPSAGHAKDGGAPPGKPLEPDTQLGNPHGADEPFFVYLATNAPHTPYLVSEEYTRPYRDNPEVPEPAFCGMIANIDENFGRLRRTLARLGLEQNTILIFMTDNGSSGGSELDESQYVARGYNAGMRGKKGSYYDGGHRVPFLIRWPGGGLKGGRNVDEMTLHIDILPTFIELCGLNAPGVDFDGESVAPLLVGERSGLPGDRVHFLQYRQDTVPPEKWTNAVMTRRWRLVRGEELYDIKADPGQRRDVAAEHPAEVERLRRAHDAWWDEISPGLEAYCPIELGNPAENPTRLCAMDVLGDVAWHQTHIAQAKRSTGTWAVEIERPGRYRFSLRRWPTERELAINGVIPPEEARRLIYAPGDARSVAIRPVEASVTVFDEEHRRPARADEAAVVFTLDLPRTGTTVLSSAFIDAGGGLQGAYYVDVEWVGET